jgi:hypothetical protein
MTRELELAADAEAVASVEGDVRLLRGLEVGGDAVGIADLENRLQQSRA